MIFKSRKVRRPRAYWVVSSDSQTDRMARHNASFSFRSYRAIWGDRCSRSPKHHAAPKKSPPLRSPVSAIGTPRDAAACAARAHRSLMADDDASTSALHASWVEDAPLPPLPSAAADFRHHLQKWSWMPSRSCRPRVYAAPSHAPAQGHARRAPLHAQALRR
jgi:hypothetical protein